MLYCENINDLYDSYVTSNLAVSNSKDEPTKINVTDCSTGYCHAYVTTYVVQQLMEDSIIIIHYLTLTHPSKCHGVWLMHK